MSILNTIKNIVAPASKQAINVPFSTRDSYIAWRANWRNDYKLSLIHI